MLFALARYGSGAYNVFKTLHILAAVVGVGGFILSSVFAAEARRRNGSEGQAIAEATQLAVTRVAEPALWLTFLLGFAVIGTSDKSVEMSEIWISISMLLALIAIVVIRFVVVKGMREGIRAGAGEAADAARKRVAAATGVTHLLLVAVLVLMVFKPGG